MIYTRCFNSTQALYIYHEHQAMTLTQQIAKQVRDFYFGGNWTGVNLKDSLEGISWQHSVTKLHSFNTIEALVFHMNYYVSAIIKVLEGGPLEAHDKLSFDHPPVLSEKDWEKLKTKTWKEAEQLAELIERLPEQKLNENFSGDEYGTYLRNIEGAIEHCHYHLGQIVLIKKIIMAEQ
jgi:uncharacterized damage-inducible protein DinB